jgi:membrane associated rhomboid family serine protease
VEWGHPVEPQELIRALCVDAAGAVRRGFALVREGPEESVLSLPTGDFLLVRTYREDDPGGTARLVARIEGLRKTIRGPVSLVVLGGRPPLDSAPFSRLSLFFVSRDGRLSGSVLSRTARSVRPLLQVALSRLRSEGPAPLSEPQHTALLGAGDAMRNAPGQGEEALFWARLREVRPWATQILTGSIVVVFLLETLWGGSESTATLYRMGANAPKAVRAGELYRLCAAAFLHIGPVHLMANLWALYVFGDFLERVLGTARFLIVYTLSAVLGSLFSVLVSHAALSAGASGALWGLMVGGFALSFSGRVPAALQGRIRARGWQPILVNLLISLAPGIDIFAHLGGGIAGGALVLLARGQGTERSAGWERPLAALCALLLGGSVVTAIVHGRPWELVAPPPGWTPVSIETVTVDVPPGLGPPRSAGDHEWALGNFPAGPVVVGLSLSGGGPLDADALREALSRESPPKGFESQEAAQVLPGARIARKRYVHPGGAVVTVWLADNAGAVLRVEVAGLPGTSAGWLNAGERIARSLRARPGP